MNPLMEFGKELKNNRHNILTETPTVISKMLKDNSGAVKLATTQTKAQEQDT